MKKIFCTFMLLCLCLKAFTLPDFHSENERINNLHKLALKEIQMDITKDGVFSAGAKWPSAWTRDMSYAVDLSLSFLFPEAVEKSLASRVENDLILQDTGSGGSWPVSTDRIVWALAAYDYALFKQNPEYFEMIYKVIGKTLEQDYKANFDSSKGLFKGETSFIDWREQSYPRWADSVYIAGSFAMGTNNVYYAALKIQEKLCGILNKPYSEKKLWSERADNLKKAVNSTFWLSEKKYYADYLLNSIHDYLYEGYETLGESLCILNDIADSDDFSSIINAVKPGPYGMSVFAPQLGGVPPYHNDAVWPFVQSYRGLACKKSGDGKACENEFLKIIEAAEKFGTFKENYVASTFSEETATNSDRQLWSVAGYLSYIYRILCGISFETNGIAIRPFVFESAGNRLTLNGFDFNGSRINLTVLGCGDSTVSYQINGNNVPQDYVIPYGENKTYNIVIRLEKSQKFTDSYDDSKRREPVFDAVAVAPVIPIVNADNEKSLWELMWRQKNDNGFLILKNGIPFSQTKERTATFKAGVNADMYVVKAVGSIPVLPSNPVRAESVKNTWLLEAEKAEIKGGKITAEENPEPLKAKLSSDLDKTTANFDSYVEKWGTAEGDFITFVFNAKKAGKYAVDFRFKNGHGPVNTGEKCALAALNVNGKEIQKIPFPHQGSWSSWNFSCPAVVHLEKGMNKITVKTDENCYTQHHKLNYVSIDLCRISKVE